MSAHERMGGEVVEERADANSGWCTRSLFVAEKEDVLPCSSSQKSREETEDERAVDQIFFTDLA
jgi:hypothetical protein